MNVYNNVDYDTFIKLNEKNHIEWKEKEKKGSTDYKNSTIYIGKSSIGSFLFCMKKIPLGNIDFEHINKPPLAGDIITVWRELMIVKILQNFHKNVGSQNFVHYYTSFIVEDNVQPQLVLLFDFIPFTLHEILQISPLSQQDEMDFLLQFSFLMMYMDNEGIHHRDLHWKNIMVDIPLIPTSLSFRYKNLNLETRPQNKIYFIVDYGYSEVNLQKSNFYEWKKFLQQLFHETHDILKSTNYSDVFKYLHSKKLWNFSKKSHLKT
jgi:hypothetical protein